MAERLIIRNFAGLNVELDIGDITIFIGPQASGKSVCARCLYWFRKFFANVIYYAEIDSDKRSMDTYYLENFKQYFPNLWQTNESFSIRYEIGEAFGELSQDKKKLRLLYPIALQNATAELRGQFRHLNETFQMADIKRPGKVAAHQFAEERDKLERQFIFKAGDIVQETPFIAQAFVVAGRSIFSALKGALLTFLSTNPLTDPLLQDFIREYEFARQGQPASDNTDLKGLNSLVESILKGRLLIQRNDDFLELANGRKILLTHASSGQQEAFPLVLFLLSYLGDTRKDEIIAEALYVEEPEAHLYPDSQWAVIRLMAGVFNLSFAASLSKLVITTHSPYLLSAFNNLIRAEQLAEQFQNQPAKLRALYRIIPKNQHLALEHFRVYALEGGQARSIISVEDGLIVADKLDEVSERISQQFDKLLQLEAQAAADEKAS